MERITCGPIEMTWYPEARLAVIRFEQEAMVTGDDARILVEALASWIGADGRPFGLLGDGGKLAGLDPEFRSVWGKFFREHRGECYAAFFNQRLAIRIGAEMFRIGMGIQLKSFADEKSARAWLRKRGIPT